MRARTQGLVLERRGRLLAMIGAVALALLVSLVAATARASAAAPEKTDIMLIFDTSGSMQGVLEEAKEEIKTLVANTRASLPNVEFGVANVEDIPGYDSGSSLEEKKTEKEYEEDPEKPWALEQSLTSEEAKIEEAINNLSGPEVAHYGGDAPETYGRALYETATNSRIGWRTGARHEIILIADNVPHTPNVNEGIPTEFQFTQPFTDGVSNWPDTGEELEGKWGIPGTTWKSGESLEFHKTLQKLDAEEKPLAMVDYFHTGQPESETFIHYWEYWAADTGGQAIGANEGAKELDKRLTEIIKESAEGIPPCAPGYERTPTTPCVKKPAAPPPPPPPHPSGIVLSTSPPTHGKIFVLEDGEVEEEDEFPEGGEADLSGEVLEWDDLAEDASFHGNPFLFGEQQSAYMARGKSKSKKCKKNFVRKHGKCVSKTTPFGNVTRLTITAPGKYKVRIKPTKSVLKVLDSGKSVHVKLTLVFTPAGTTDHITSVREVTVHKHKKSKHKKKKK